MGGGVGARCQAPGDEDEKPCDIDDVDAEERRRETGSSEVGGQRREGGPWTEHSHEARPDGREPAEAAVPCYAVADDHQHLSRHDEQPNGEDHGVYVSDQRRLGLFVQVARNVEAEAAKNAEPEDGEPDDGGNAVITCAPRAAVVQECRLLRYDSSSQFIPQDASGRTVAKRQRESNQFSKWRSCSSATRVFV